MFSLVNSLENGVRENNIMGGSFFFKTSGLCGFVHIFCAPDSDLKVMQKHFRNYTVILDHQYFFILLFLFFLNVNHAYLLTYLLQGAESLRS
jgi:hypothetical protein